MKTIFLVLISLILLGSSFAYAANEYTNSAHGNSSTGVKDDLREAPDTSDYATGNCAHCHLYQHQSLNGVASGTALSPQDRADIVPFCLECHGGVQGSSAAITWNSVPITDNNIHGDRNITNTVSLKDLQSLIDAGDITDTDGNYSISCIVCHEPHGTSNVMLIREEVNGEEVGSGTFTTTSSEDCSPQYTDNADDWKNLCSRCHDGTYEYMHHLSADRPYVPVGCSECHEGNGGKSAINCTCCHYHGSSAVDSAEVSRVTF